jgi:protein TonB
MAYTYKSRKSLSQRFFAVGFVIAFHVAVVYLLVSGLGQSLVQVVTGPIEMNVIEEVQEQEAEPPPPPPDLKEPPPEFVPPPDIMIAPEIAPANNTAITKVAAKPQPKKVEPPPPAPTLKRRRGVEFQPEYPPSSKRAGEEGTVMLEICVDPDGKVVDAKVIQSTGFPKLDETAQKYALRKWRFNSIPQQVCGIAAPVKFQLKK